MDSGKRKIIAISLVAILVMAVAAVVLASGALGPKNIGSGTDAAGNMIVLDNPPQRIVSCSPSLSEMAYALGLGDQMVAVTKYCDYPEGIRDLRDSGGNIGGYYDPSFEKVLEFQPDLVLVDHGTETHQRLAEKLMSANVTVLQMFPQDDLASVYKSIGLLGNVTGRTDAAAETISSMRSQVQDIADRVEGRDAPDVLYVAYTQEDFTGLYVTGSGTAVDEIIGLAGGQNIFPEQDDWFSPSSELLKQKAAEIDVMIITSMFSSTAAQELNDYFNRTALWQTCPAVQDNRIFYLSGQGVKHLQPPISESGRGRTADGSDLPP